MLLLRGLRHLDVTWKWKWHFISQTLKESGAREPFLYREPESWRCFFKKPPRQAPHSAIRSETLKQLSNELTILKKILQVCSDVLVFLPRPLRLENLSLSVVEGVLGVPDFPLAPMVLSLA